MTRPQDSRPLLLYLITNDISSLFLRGQLHHLMCDGYDVIVGTCCNQHDAAPPFDRGAKVFDLPYERQPAPITDLRALYATARLLRREKPDLVNASTPKAGLLGMVAAWICRVPIRVYVVRGFRFETVSGARKRLYRTMEWLAIRSATNVIFNSASLRTVAEQEGLLPQGTGDILGNGSGNGIDPKRFANRPHRHEARRALGLDDRDDVIGFVGRLTRDKGAADLIAAFIELETANPSLRLLLVGMREAGDPLDVATQTTIEQHPHIVTVDRLDSPGVAYSAMDILAFPSYREGMPNVPLEAQLCGVPVVGYATTGMVDAVQSGVTGLLVPKGNHKALAEGIRALLQDAELRLRMGQAGSQWVQETFAQERIWRELADRYRTWFLNLDSPIPNERHPQDYDLL